MLDDAAGLDYGGCRRLLWARLRERPPGRIQLLAGPRQVGKTTLLLELARRLGAGARYAALDGPEAALPGAWERLWSEAVALAERRGRAALLLDEIQHVASWAARLKAEWDRVRRSGAPLHVVASGSSALRIGSGSRESLAGRFERITLAHWPASAVRDLLGVPGRSAPETVVRLGCYPGALALRKDEARLRAYVRDSIVEPAIGRDLLALEPVRRPALLRQVFSLCASLPAQVVSLQKLQGRLSEAGALETIAHYLELLEEAFLVATLDKFSERAVRRRAAPPKIVVLNNALLAATDLHGVPDPDSEPARFGTWVENGCLAHAWNSGQRVSYWREEPLEVDAVVEGSWGAWAIEVKAGAFDTASLRGLFEFCRRHSRFRPLLLTGPDGGRLALRTAIDWMPWTRFLLQGPPRGGRR